MKRIYLLLVLILTVQSLPAQDADIVQDSAVKSSDDSYAPLLLYTSGEGRIVPFDDGQMLEVGRAYKLVAIPDRGYVFANWQPVYVYTFTEILHQVPGGPPSVRKGTLVSPVPDYTSERVIRFTMQPEDVLLATPARTITKSIGWQANFVPKAAPDFEADEDASH